MKRMNDNHYARARRANAEFAARQRTGNYLRSDLIVALEEEQERLAREDSLPQAVDEFMEDT